MRNILCASLLCASLLLPLAAQETPATKPTPEQLAARRRGMMEKTGGFVPRPVGGPVLLVVNTQSKFASAAVEQGIQEIARVIQAPYRLESGDAKQAPFEAARAAMAAGPDKVAFAVVVVDSPDLPLTLVAPEACWAILNVAGLEGSKPVSNEVLEARFKRQLWRTATWVMGGGTSPVKSAMSPAFSADELDGIGQATAPDLLNRVLDVAKRRGMRQQGMTTYRKACEEGWAPAPANPIQQAVWDEVKKGK